MSNSIYKARARSITRFLERYKKQTTTSLTGRVSSSIEFRLIMKLVRDWLRLNVKNSSYLGVLEQGKVKIHYHAIVWRMRNGSPCPLAKSQVKDLTLKVHSNINLFRVLARDRMPKKAMRLTLLRQQIEDKLLPGVGNPLYEIKQKKLGVPMGWGGNAARYVLKTIIVPDRQEEFITSSGISACLRKIKAIQKNQSEDEYVFVLKGYAGPFNLKTVSSLVYTIIQDLDKGLDIHKLSHRWYSNKILIRYDGIKLIRNELVKLGIGTLYTILRTKKIKKGRGLEPTNKEATRYSGLQTACRKVLGRFGRWWALRHDWTYQQFLAAAERERQRIGRKNKNA